MNIMFLLTAGFYEGAASLFLKCAVFVPMVGLTFFRFMSGTIFAFSESVFFITLEGEYCALLPFTRSFDLLLLSSLCKVVCSASVN